MSVVITSRCEAVCDTVCVEVCPVDAIHGPGPAEQLKRMTPEAKQGLQLFIDPDQCICCNACIGECPVEAIFDEADLPPEHLADVERNARFFRR